MLTYLQTRDETQCCGCRACVQKCPFGALRMLPNSEGFMYPEINISACKNCGLCDRVCPMQNRPIGSIPIDVYAVQNKDDVVLFKSSSGGVFRLLADYVIEQLDGCVVGCVWDKKRPILKMAETLDELIAMQGSKYLYSSTENIYNEVQVILNTGRKVLFTGSPCQCAGLLNFLQKKYDNLVMADFLCHGMPSQKIFDTYVNNLEEKHSSEIANIKFRDKALNGWGYAFSYTFKNKKKIEVGITNPYLFGYVKGYFNRYSCYQCPFRGENRFTDFTFCDYWGIKENKSGLEIDKGVSAVSINTITAIKIKQRIEHKATWIWSTVADVANANPDILYKTMESIPDIRKKIYDEIDVLGWNVVKKKHLRIKYMNLTKLWYGLPIRLRKAIKNFLQ